MKAIHADPRAIRKLLTDDFIIPDFQRPYSWTIEHCDKLWDDLISFNMEKKDSDDNYFLGNIVIHPQNGSYAVIDGQQRLTTLLLLIKALHLRAGTIIALEKCLKKEDPLTSELLNEIRVVSHVFENDKESLYDIIFNNGINLGNNKFKINFDYLIKKIDIWWLSVGNSPGELNSLILTLLDNVVLLPIQCDSQDDALTIFQTINDRGMALSDADIFKAKLHASALDKTDFIDRWNSLEDHLWLFRVHMHISRAKFNDTSKENALRTYFDDKNKLQNDYDFVLDSLKKTSDIDEWEATDLINIMWSILEVYPNYYWNFPIFVFLHKYGEYDSNGDFFLSEDNESSFNELITDSVKYFYVKGVVHNSVNAVRDTVFKVCALIANDGDYLSEFKNNSMIDEEEFVRRLTTTNYGRYLKGLVLLGACLNKNQDNNNFADFLNTNYHIEHILPKKWNNYDEWTDESWQDNINKLGNLVPLEWRLNISAKNEFFSRKKQRYLNSKVEDVTDLVDIVDWVPTELEERHKIILDRLIKFFTN
jgi:uncharacterized protein with ParB-like and HNH nuclease domain